MLNGTGAPENTTTIECRYICKDVYLEKTIDLLDALVASVPDKKLLSKILPRLAVDSSLSHLKRVHRGCFIIGSKDDVHAEKKARAIFEELDCTFTLESTRVPRSAPLTRIQLNFCQEVWPVHFRENTELERRLGGTYFSARELQIFQKLMDNARDDDGCIITTGNYKIVGRASESRMSKEEPLKHPFMRAFDHLTQSHAMATKRSSDNELYIGTGCIVFIYEEPCAMCAMALVHARVKTVFFKETSKKGAFLTNCQLHLKPQLNHHYDVFQLLY